MIIMIKKYVEYTMLVQISYQYLYVSRYVKLYNCQLKFSGLADQS